MQRPASSTALRWGRINLCEPHRLPRTERPPSWKISWSSPSAQREPWLTRAAFPAVAHVTFAFVSKALARTSLAIIGGVGAVYAVATLWGFYPLGLIVLLVIALVAALYVAQVEHRRASTNEQALSAGPPSLPDPAERRHDAKVVAEIRDILTRRDVTRLREHDFGALWMDEWMDGVREVARREDPEHIVFAPDLQQALTGLFDALRVFNPLVAGLAPTQSAKFRSAVGH
jgi:hypothetical protein